MQAPPAVFDASHAGSPSAYKANETAVLLMDYVGMVVGMTGEAGAAAVAKAEALRKWAQEKNILVIHCGFDTEMEPVKVSKVGPLLQFLKGKMAETPGAEKEPASLASQDSAKEPTFVRQLGMFSAFSSHGIEDVLKKHGIKSLILGGISTSIIVLRTTAAAAEKGYVVTVVRDACADTNPASQETVLNDILPIQASITTVEELQRELAKTT